MKLELPRPGFQIGAVWYSTSASSPYPAHYHDQLEVNIVLRGHGTYLVESGLLPIGPTSIVLLPPGAVHQLVDVSADFTAWIVEIETELVVAAGLHELLDLSPRTIACDASTVAKLSKECAPHLILKSPNATSLASIVAATAGALHSERVDRSPFELHPAVAWAADLLETEQVGFEHIALRVGLSRSRLTHMFTQQLGVPPIQYRNHLRIQHFITHLHQTGADNMLAAALDAGFGSYPQFHRVFRQVTGYSPSEHRRRVESGIIQPVAQGPRGDKVDRTPT